MDSRDIEKWRIELDSYANVEDGVEYWLARDLMEPMGYTRWENFAEVVKRAKVSCETNKTPVDSHFRDTTKMVTAGVAARAVKDYKLTRYACYLIAQNGDSNKPEIALAQAYFAVQTRRQELIEQRFAEIQRLQARHSLSDSEKQLSGIAFKRGVDSKGFAIIKSKGDEALFGGRSTAEMKQQLGVPKRAALADRLADVLIKAKDLTNSMTAFNAEEHDLYGLDQIKQEHVENNTSVRGSLIDRGIVPENLPSAEDTKKLERRVKADEKKLKEGTDGFADNSRRVLTALPIHRVDSICKYSGLLWWAVRGSACCAGGRCGAKAPCALRWQTLTRFLSSAPFRVRPHVRSTKKTANFR